MSVIRSRVLANLLTHNTYAYSLRRLAQSFGNVMHVNLNAPFLNDYFYKYYTHTDSLTHHICETELASCVPDFSGHFVVSKGVGVLPY